MIRINRQVFLGALQNAGSFVNPRSPKQVLGCVKVTAGDTSVVVQANNLERAFRQFVLHLETGRPWNTLVNYKDLINAVSKIPDEEITLELPDKLVLRGEEAKFDLLTLTSDDFDGIRDCGDVAGTVSAGGLKQAIARTIYCTTKVRGEYSLSGLQFTLKKGLLVVAATDRTQCSRQEVRLDRSEEEEVSFLLPASSASAIRSAVEDPDEQVEIKIDGTRVLFVIGRIEIQSNTYHGSFPPVDKLFAHEPETTTVGADKLLIAAEQAAAVTRHSETTEGAVFNFTLDKLIVEAEAASHGKLRSEIPFRWNWKPRTICINPSNLVHAIKASGLGDVELGIARNDELLTVQREDGFKFINSRIVRNGL